MWRTGLFLSGLAVLALAVGLAGCAPQQSTPDSPATAAGTQTQPAEQAGQMDEGGEHEGSGRAERAAEAGHGEQEDALAALSPADRALAQKQKVCPVSGEPLGSMGTPYKVTVKGRDVFLCCKGCEGEIKANPDEYLAKLPE